MRTVTMTPYRARHTMAWHDDMLRNRALLVEKLEKIAREIQTIDVALESRDLRYAGPIHKIVYRS